MHDHRTVLAQIAESQARLERTLAGLSTAETRAPSGLPGWSRGHVANHLARNADSYWRLLEWARTGVENLQYPSLEARAAEIDAGADRPADELYADNRDAAARFADQAASLPERAWDATVLASRGWPHPAWYTLYRRWREVEVHHVDLDAGYGPADWPAAYLRWELGDTFAALAARGPLPYARVSAPDLGFARDLGGDGPVLEASGVELLCWLTGRAPSPHPGLADPSWPLAPADDWTAHDLHR